MIKNRDVVSGLCWLVIGLGLSLWTLTSYEIGRLTQPGPGYLPLGLGILLVLLSLILLIGQRKKTAILSAQSTHPVISFFGWKKVLYTVTVLVVTAFLLEPLGYLLTFFLLIVLLMKGVARQGWIRILLTALCTTVLVYVVFDRLLGLQLPRGLLGG